jgi:hypothetical protein
MSDVSIEGFKYHLRRWTLTTRVDSDEAGLYLECISAAVQLIEGPVTVVTLAHWLAEKSISTSQPEVRKSIAYLALSMLADWCTTLPPGHEFVDLR